MQARGRLDVRKDFTFLPKKILWAKFYAGKGKAWRKERLHIFAEENFVSKILCRQGEGTKWLTIFAEEMKFAEFFSGKRGRLAKTSSVGRSRQLPRRGSRERGLSIKRLFDEKNAWMLFGWPSSPCFARSLPPRGSLGKRKKFESTSIVCLRRHFPKRGKQECELRIKRLFEKNAWLLFGCPSFVQSFALSTFPPRGRHEVADNFMQARGRHAKK